MGIQYRVSTLQTKDLCLNLDIFLNPKHCFMDIWSALFFYKIILQFQKSYDSLYTSIHAGLSSLSLVDVF